MEKKMTKIFYFISALATFCIFLALILFNFNGHMTTETIEKIDYSCLTLGLIVYIADTSGALERSKEFLTPARAVTFITITLSLMLHVFTPKNVMEHFGMFVGLAGVLLLICLAALSKKLCLWVERKGRKTLLQQSEGQNLHTIEPDDRKD